MLVLKRKEGQWVEIHHRSGDVIRLRVYDIALCPSRVNIAFDDAPRNFEIRRPDKGTPRDEPAPGPGPRPAVCPIAPTPPEAEPPAGNEVPTLPAV